MGLWLITMFIHDPWQLHLFWRVLSTVSNIWAKSNGWLMKSVLNPWIISVNSSSLTSPPKLSSSSRLSVYNDKTAAMHIRHKSTAHLSLH